MRTRDDRRLLQTLGTIKAVIREATNNHQRKAELRPVLSALRDELMQSIDSSQLKSEILTTPIAEVISRKRTYTLAQLRADFRDSQTQFIVLLTQLHDEHFTGSLTLHFNSGHVCAVETVDSQKIKP